MIPAWIVAAAFAQEERCKPLDLPAMIESLDRSELAFEQGDSAAGTKAVDDLKSKLRCLVELPTPALMARLASLEALAGHFDQDTDRSVRWARAAEWIEPGHLWPGAVSADHPLRSLVAEEGPATIGAKGRHGFVLPEHGAVVLSGRLVVDTDVPTDVPLLLQVCDANGHVVRAEWQEGGSFPADLVGDVHPLVPLWWTRAVPPGAVREEPPPVVRDPVAASGPGTRVAVFAAGGGGSAGQSLDQPGDFLAAKSFGGALVALGALARAPLSDTVGLFADGRVALPGNVAASESFAGLAFGGGAVKVQVGGGFTTSPVWEADERRRFIVGQPLVAVEAAVPVGDLALDVRGGGGYLPGAAHARLSADVRSTGRVGFTGGLEAGVLRTGFVQPSSSRELAVTSLFGGLRAGATFGG